MTTPLLLHGTPVAKALRSTLATLCAGFVRAPHLCIVQVGDDFGSERYIRQKIKAAASVGIKATHVHLPATITETALQEVLKAHTADPEIDGIILQSPLPSHLSFAKMLPCITPDKDVDGLHPYNQGGIRQQIHYFSPCTPQGIIHLLQHYGIALEGLHVGIINRSSIVGRPLADLLLNNGATVSICHSRTQDLASLARTWDILVSATGIPGFITQDYCTPDTIVIDVGCSPTPTGFAGDLAPECHTYVGGYTPAPGGVGPMTVAMLLHNTVQAYMRQQSN